MTSENERENEIEIELEKLRVMPMVEQSMDYQGKPSITIGERDSGDGDRDGKPTITIAEREDGNDRCGSEG